MSMIQLEVKDHVAVITMNRPEAYNAVNRELAIQLQEALDQCKEDENVRAILLRAVGKAFCAGQDLKAMESMEDLDISKTINEQYNPLIERLTEIEKPIVCAVQGVAAGAGANIALACDIVIAGDNAIFSQAFSSIGLIPDSGGTYILPRLIGLQKAKALMMLADKITGSEADAMGMIYKSVPDEDLQSTAFELAVRLADRPTIALGLIKRALNRSLHSDIYTQLSIEEQLQTIAGQSMDFKEGVLAFLEKRKPVFTGK